ncbi:MAG: UDP-N-acetylenolpyruvoylglucosamine reductase, partial [Neisseriaceae bacterium]|nr:UDP-N-acetylenolpyruvoylglucosamine reductase [Neisseriaceae bacterium]
MNIQHNIALKNYNTMGLAVFAKYFYKLTDNAQLADLLKEIKKYPQTYFLGGGSNTVFLHDFDGLVVHLATRGIEYQKIENNQVLV